MKYIANELGRTISLLMDSGLSKKLSSVSVDEKKGGARQKCQKNIYIYILRDEHTNCTKASSKIYLSSLRGVNMFCKKCGYNRVHALKKCNINTTK